jgi:hypothetical protein
MKKTIIYITTVCFVMLLFQRCQLTEVTDLKPANKLDENIVVTDIPSAEKLLAGAYFSLRDEAMANQLPIYTSLMGINVTSTAAADLPFLTNSVLATDTKLTTYLYSGPYQLIQTAGFVIEKTGALQTDNPRKAQIVAEARFLRALGHFYILRLYGQFWDLNSAYGIEIKDKPNLPIAARSSVKTAFDFILADLDQAIAACPEYKTGVSKGYATKLAAKAVKAKVLLYKKDYPAAAALAKEVMGSPAVLSANFFNMFQNEKYNSDEVILASITFANNNNLFTENGKTLYWNSRGYTLTNRYTALLGTDARKSILVKNATDALDPLLWHGNGKFSKGVDGSRNDTEYYFRKAEAYLIFAEAEARRDGGSLTDASDAVNALRTRRAMGSITPTDKTQLLALIRTEKELELGAESGEDWFDIVRYIKAGDLLPLAVKASLLDQNKLILPIPKATIDAARGVIQQNPGY